MAFEEKLTWVNAIVTVIVAGAYFAIVGARLGDTTVDRIAYQIPMIVAIVASVVLTIVGTIAAAIGSAVTAEITGEGSIDEVDRSDERDKDINRRGELAGYYASSIGLIAALALAMTRQDAFWIANAIYMSFVIATVVSSVTKLVLYRRGF